MQSCEGSLAVREKKIKCVMEKNIIVNVNIFILGKSSHWTHYLLQYLSEEICITKKYAAQ